MKPAPDRPVMPPAQRAYGAVVYWMTFAACVVAVTGPLLSLSRPERNVLHPLVQFAAIFEGQDAAGVWAVDGGEFPGGHFYLRHPRTGDGFTLLGIALVGCTAAGWGLLAAALAYARQRDGLYVAMCLFIVLLIVLSLAGAAGTG